MVVITKCPPGVALGAGDLHRWAHNRQVGRAGVKGQRDKDIKAWTRNPENVSKDGHALTFKQIRERRKAKRIAKRKAERLRQRAQRLKERDTNRNLRSGKLVLWGDTWPDAGAPDMQSDSVMQPEPADPNEPPPWE